MFLFLFNWEQSAVRPSVIKTDRIPDMLFSFDSSRGRASPWFQGWAFGIASHSLMPNSEITMWKDAGPGGKGLSLWSQHVWFARVGFQPSRYNCFPNVLIYELLLTVASPVNFFACAGLLRWRDWMCVNMSTDAVVYFWQDVAKNDQYCTCDEAYGKHKEKTSCSGLKIIGRDIR